MKSGALLISCGDPNGIGPEISVKAIKKSGLDIRKRIVLIGPEKVLRKAGWTPSLAPILDVSENFSPKPGKVDARAGLISFKCFSLACKLASKENAAIITAPISKEAWLKAGIPYMGHTAYLKFIFKKEPVMSFHCGDFNAFLITEHIPFKEVSSSLRKESIVSKVKTFASSFNIKKNARILFCGVNPHCGENGKLGTEELYQIKPSINSLKKFGFDVLGPFNPEDVFLKYFKLHASAAVFMYHDQLLSPMRLVFKDIVHATWGLPFIRTSPAHGTAFDIAWKDRADSGGMLAAINFAYQRLKK